MGESRQVITSGERADGVRRRFDRGRAAWPDVALSFDVFQAYAMRHAKDESLPAEAYAPDMYLACACAHGLKLAIKHLERTLVPDVARAVASIDSSPAFVEEVLQLTRVRLLVRKDDGPSKMADYAGRATLKSWLSAAAVRCALSQKRRKGGEPAAPSPGEDLRLAKGGPEFEYLRRRYKEVFEETVRAAIQALSAKERMLLRLNLAEGMSVDKLGAMYRVGRSTAARWLAAARAALLDQVRRDLRAKLKLTSTELESLGAEIQSQLEVSLVSLLQH